MTVIHGLAQQHKADGGHDIVVVGQGTAEGFPPYGVGQLAEVAFGDSVSRNGKAVDVLAGRLGLGRPVVSSLYRPVLSAIPADFSGVVFVHNAPGAIIALHKARPKARFCLYAHNLLFRNYTRMEARRVLNACYRVICVSRFVARDLEAKIGCCDPRIRVVLNGVDTERFCPDTKRMPRRGEPVVLFLGRVVPEKGADLLVRAAVRLYDGKRRFRLRIVGSSGFSASDPLTPYEADLRRLAAPLGNAAEFVPFVPRDRVLALYRDADVFCAPSNWDDPCPLNVLEALACGLPMVASARGGIPEECADCALYFRPPDDGGLANSLAALLDDSNAAAQLGERARKRAKSLSWAASYRSMLGALAD